MQLIIAYLLQNPNFSTCQRLQSSSKLLVFYASRVFDILKTKLLGIIKQHQNDSLE